MKNNAIFKFNGSLGALLCSQCSKIIKTGIQFTEEESMAMRGKIEMAPQYCEDCDNDFKPTHKYMLFRSDGLRKKGNHVMWIEWNEDGTFKDKHDEPAVGRSLILDGDRFEYTWLTTSVKEILEQKENFINFTTKNSHYKLYTYEQI